MTPREQPSKSLTSIQKIKTLPVKKRYYLNSLEKLMRPSVTSDYFTNKQRILNIWMCSIDSPIVQNRMFYRVHLRKEFMRGFRRRSLVTADAHVLMSLTSTTSLYWLISVAPIVQAAGNLHTCGTRRDPFLVGGNFWRLATWAWRVFFSFYSFVEDIQGAMSVAIKPAGAPGSLVCRGNFFKTT